MAGDDRGRLSLHPLSLEEALRAAMLTGPPEPGPKRERKARAAGPAKPPGGPKRAKAHPEKAGR